ncbi:MAG TPA: response regulator [Dehalococcoidales bacterium]|nr:response regulator [Dehalococcoidales bacterium]
MLTEERKETILIVDDEEPVRRPLKRLLVKNGYSCLEADSAASAMDHLREHEINLAVLDIMMPHKSGLELLPEIKNQYPNIAVVMATAVIEPEIIISCMREGAQDYITKPFDLNKVLHNIEMVLNKKQLELTIKQFQASLQGKVESQALEIRRLFLGSIESLICALESKDRYTAGHSRRVSAFTMTISQNLEISDGELEDIRYGALLHDVGKIAINPQVQNKPGKLTQEEYKYIMTHAQIGPSIVKPIANKNIIDIIKYHHTRFDGQVSGQILAGAQIPVGVRMVTLADAFDAMTSERPYRQPLPIEKALSELKSCSGTQFDPKIVEAFLNVPDVEIQRIIKLF